MGAGWSSPVARQAHNLKVAGSNPAPATNRSDYIPRSRGTSQSSDWLFYCPRRAPCLGFAPPHARRAPMLTINGLTVRLGGRAILDRASASLPARSRTGLIGRHGAGKSTLLKARSARRGVGKEGERT